ncbi:hypothetical protein HLPCO_001407 [Haloplasma contractile SSD-17B]|uniref:DUF4956 domain-containing protein n=2 Tax=Haloplasma TaxID=471824 RepID=U2ECB9_9MOLU|nr:hypothetical protein HLPCO_001407 [Haloplasma contractile SSD-17B]
MVGALSIVRFRTAIKDPIDIVYIFWSISVGLAIGSNQYLIGFVGSSFLALILILSNLIRIKSKSVILIINYDYTYEDDVNSCIKRIKHAIKSKHTTNNQVELTLEIKQIKDDILRALNDASFVHNTSLLQYDE